MSFFRQVLSYIVPLTVKHTSSQYNKDIRVINYAGSFRLVVDGIEQSSPRFYKMWEDVFRMFIPENTILKKILVLGIGGSNVIHLLHKSYPDARIVVIDIDREIIRLSNKYFGLSTIPGLKYAITDAEKYIEEISENHRRIYDLIVIDVYIGSVLPSFTSRPEFYERISSVLTDTGFGIVNYSPDSDFDHDAHEISSILESIYDSVSVIPIVNNRFICFKYDRDL